LTPTEAVSRVDDVPIRVILADDHPVVLEALGELFAGEPDIAVLARCRGGEEVLDALRRHPADVLVLDLSMPGIGGLGVLRALVHEGTAPAIALYTARVDATELREARRLGVRGVVLKEKPPDVLVDCVRALHAGEPWFDTDRAR